MSVTYEKPNCPSCRGEDRTRHVHMGFGSIPDSDKYGDIWVCAVHGTHIKEVEGHLR